MTLVEAVAAAAPSDAVLVTSHGNVDFWADETLQVRRRRVPEVIAAVGDLLSKPGPSLLHVPIAAVESPYMEHISR